MADALFDGPRAPFCSRERLFWVCLALYIAVLPMSSTIALRYLAFMGMIVAALWALVRREARLCFPVAIAWTPYAAAALLSLTFALDVRYSASEIRNEIVYGAITFIIGASLVAGQERLRRLAWIVVACDAFMVAYSLYLAAMTPATATALIGSFHVKTGSYSTYLVTVSPLLMLLVWKAWQRRERRVFALVAVLIAANIVSLYFTANRQGLLVYGLQIALVGFFALREKFDRRAAVAMVSLVLFVAALFVAQIGKRHEMMPSDAPVETQALYTLEGDPRWNLWRYTSDAIAQQPWHGAGFGRQAFKLAHSEYQRAHPILWHAHNMVLNKGVQMGIPGMAAFLVLWLALAIAVARGMRLGADPGVAACAVALLAGVFVKNMTDDFFVEDNALMFWLLCGALLGTLQRR